MNTDGGTGADAEGVPALGARLHFTVRAQLYPRKTCNVPITCNLVLSYIYLVVKAVNM